MNRKSILCTLGLSPREANTEAREAQVSGAAEKRLAKAFACLENIERRREQGRDSLIDRWMEKRVIWRELLELELQAMRHSDSTRAG